MFGSIQCQRKLISLMYNTYRVGLVGLGHQGTKHFLPGIFESTNTRLVAVCDLNGKLAAHLGTQLNVPYFANCREMLDSVPLDFIITAVPHHHYKDVLITASEASVHVLKEKPLALNLEEAKLFHEISLNSKIEIMTTLQRRFHPAYRTFHVWLSMIGDVEEIDMHYTLGLSKPNSGWRGNATLAGGGCLIDMGYHIIDILLWNFHLPESVKAKLVGFTTPEHTATVFFNYSVGLKGRMHISRVEHPKRERITIIGKQGTIEISNSIVSLKVKNNTLQCIDFSNISTKHTAVRQINYFTKVLSGQAFNFANPKNHFDHMRFLQACYSSHQHSKGVYL